MTVRDALFPFKLWALYAGGLTAVIVLAALAYAALRTPSTCPQDVEHLKQELLRVECALHECTAHPATRQP